jgi:hypothetical protein
LKMSTAVESLTIVKPLQAQAREMRSR